MKNFLLLVAFVAFTYLLNAYNDTEEFQAFMEFIFSPSYSIPAYWLENRLLILGALCLLLIVLYHSVWSSCKRLLHVYRNSPSMSSKPPLTVQQSSYILLKNDALCVSSWLIELCQSGVLTLHYNKSSTPWSLSRNPGMLPPSELDKKLLNELFTDDIKAIKDNSYNPDPDFQALSKKLLKKIKSDISQLTQPGINSFFAWFILFVLLLELAFINSLYPQSPGLIIIATVIALSTAAATYSIFYNLPYFFTSNKGMAYIIVTVLFIVTVVVHWGTLNIYQTVPYFSSYFYPDLVAAIAAAAAGIPLLTKDPFLQSQIIGYQKHLETSKAPIKESELPWVFGLDSISAFSLLKVSFKDNRKPDWLKYNNEDEQELIQCLHESFVNNVNHAINGRKKSSRSSRSGSRIGNEF